MAKKLIDFRPGKSALKRMELLEMDHAGRRLRRRQSNRRLAAFLALPAFCA
jgi:hypothetical protein